MGTNGETSRRAPKPGADWLYNRPVTASSKFYVVWKGHKRGVFASWTECEKQVKGYVGAEFKAFGSLPEARAALAAGYESYRGQPASRGKWKRSPSKPRLPSVSVDAACSGSPGPLEYRGVDTESGRPLFRAGPFREGTNNVGEFLGIVEALRWLVKHGHDWPVYSDSENAISWVKRARANTKLRPTAANRQLFQMMRQAEADLPSLLVGGEGRARPAILKWETKDWGEIPADFGRK